QAAASTATTVNPISTRRSENARTTVIPPPSPSRLSGQEAGLEHESGGFVRLPPVACPDTALYLYAGQGLVMPAAAGRSQCPRRARQRRTPAPTAWAGCAWCRPGGGGARSTP